MTHNGFLADLMLVLMALSLVAALVAVAWSSFASLRRRKQARNYRQKAMSSVEGGEGNAKRQKGRGLLSGRNVTMMTTIGTILLLVLTFLLASVKPLLINGHRFESTFWLRAADMFIASSVVLLLVAAVAYVYAEYVSRKLSNQSSAHDLTQES